MRAILLSVLLLPGLIAAAEAEPTAPSVAGIAADLSASAAAAMPVEVTPGAALSITLKDGQQLQGHLLKYDDYFLSVKNQRGTSFDLPWVEVQSVESSALGADLPLMQGRLTGAASAVHSLVQARNPSTALAHAFWPGILLHGAGNRYAGNDDRFVSLVGAELFGVVVGGFGANEYFGPGKDGEHKDTALALTVGGGVIFGLSWLWDIATSASAARTFNEAHGLALLPTQNGAQLAFNF